MTLAGTGKLRVAAGGGTDEGYAAVRQSDGKLIVAGESDNAGVTVPSLVRYNANGTLDTAFGNGGKVLLESVFGGARAVAIAPSTGKILVAGFASLSATDSSFLLARLNTDGTLDTGFNGNGFLFTAMTSGMDVAHAMAVQTDGRIVLAGEAGGSIALARYDADGVLDSTLDGDGKLISGLGGTARALLLMSGTSSRMVVAGQQIVSGQGRASVIRFNFNGTIDTGFGGGSGFVTRTDLTEANGLTLLAILAGEEKLIITGGMPSGSTGGPVPVPGPAYFGLWSLDASTGAADTAFGTSGALIDVADPGVAVRVQFSGGSPSRLVVLKRSSQIQRFTLTGAVDAGFGSAGGKADSLVQYGRALLLQPDGRMVTAGTEQQDLAISRLTFSGAADTSFSSDGIRREDVGSPAAAARATLVQPDGKLLVAGDSALVRLLADGTLDSSFDEDGRVPLRFSIACMALQPDGKIAIMGNAETVTGSGTVRTARLLRYHPDGVVDLDGSGTGQVAGTAQAMLVQPDGKVLVAGVYEQELVLGLRAPFLAVYRYLAGGSLDNTFSGDGVATVAASGILGEGGGDAGARGLALQADGRIVVAGRLPGPANFDFGIARLLPDGTLDSSFSGDGITTIPMGAEDDFPAALVLQAGRIVVAGTVGAAADDVGLVRLLSDGTLDSTFGTAGKTIVSLSPGDDTAGALLVQHDGKLCLAGTATNGLATEFVLARFSANGALDSTFGVSGKTTVDLTPGSAEQGLALAIDPVRRFVIAGGASGVFGISRVLGDPFASITRISRDAVSGEVLLEGYATPGFTSRLSTGTALSGFTPSGSVAPGASGFWQRVQISADPRRFYRLSVP